MIFDEGRYILCGDQYLAVYYGDEGSLEENFLAITINQAIERAKIEGIVEAAVTASSILVRYDPFVLEGLKLISEVKEITRGIKKTKRKIEINSAVMTIPVLYDDWWTRECAKSHNVPPNLEVIAEFNGLATIEEVIKIHSDNTYWVRYLAGPGLIGLIPLDQDRVLFAPKYEKPRAWTPGRTLALGGNCTSYYPFEMPGGSMLLGRLPVPLFDPVKSHPTFEKSPSICNIGDRIKIVPITEREYGEIEKNFIKYEYSVQPGVFEFELKEDRGA
jgi:allophanate hydrolase subunit 1